jgi:uncharacterized cupin superfamily protein
MGPVRRFNLLTGDLDSDLKREGFAWRAADIGEKIGGEKIDATLYDLPEGQQTWPYHYHHGVEEWAYVVGGSPRLRTPDGERTLKGGDIVCFPSGPDGAHALHGPGQVVIFSAASKPSICGYPDSDKIGTRGDEEDRLNFMRADAVGYWDGE